MNAHNGPRRPSGFWFLGAGALVVFGSVVLVQSFQGAAAEEGEKLAASYARGIVHAAIPFHAALAGAGELTVEILDPDDQVLGRVERRVDVEAGKGTWREDVKLAKELALDDVVWDRLRYRFAYADSKAAGIAGTESISQILRQPVLRIVGQQSYLAGGEAAVRVIVTDSHNEPVAGASSVRIELQPPGQKARLLFSGVLNRRGTTEAQFRLPAGLVGNFPLRYVAETPIGSTEFIQEVRLEDKSAILLTTEKPLYQPGQTIHVRALALDRANHQASAGRNLTFEVEDSRGNKVFKKVTQTDAFGIASVEFGLADEVNLGTYHLRAVMDTTNTAEIALNVERYVLPKFKVAVDFAGADQKAKRGYRPGDHVTGTVRANYFFGKPVDRAEVTLKASGMDVAEFNVAAADGKTDADGAYRFDIPLPRYFAGRPLSAGAARVLIEATVKDSAGHSETRGEPVTVSESPLMVTAVPEGGKLIPNLENQVFILTSYPDGQPAVADVTVHAAGNAEQKASTDQGGVAVVRIKAGVQSGALRIEAQDREGNRASNSLQLEVRDGQDQILLRTERAVYRAGDHISLHVFTTKSKGAAYVDVVREGQTVLTRDVEIVNGQAELSLTATPDLAGTLDIDAYLFGSDARPSGDHRLVFVQPADELKIEATNDNPVYKPGDDARIRFRVTNSRGEGVHAALGVQVVDEAVFALAEKQPGFAKVFFYLEQEAMKPRYEIHSIGMPEIVEPVEPTAAVQRDRAARALFAATETLHPNQFETEAGRGVPMAKYQAYSERYWTRFDAQAAEYAERLNRAYAANSERGDLVKVAASMTAAGQGVRDAWDTNLRLDHVAWTPTKTFVLRSAGPDKQFDTPDDKAVLLAVQTRKTVGQRNTSASSFHSEIEHDRGAYNGRAEITGTVVDQDGGAIEGANVILREEGAAATRLAKVNADGRFSFAAVPAGEYTVEVASGSRTISKRLTLRVRDRAVLAITLNDENPFLVVVEPSSRIQFENVDGIRPQFAAAGMMGGVGGGRAEALGLNGRDAAELMMVSPAPQAMVAADSGMASTTLATGSVANIKELPGAPAPHVRSYFPEALYINPEIITDASGFATIAVPLADSVTTWRMAMVASTAGGALGSGASSIKVFQDFFVDLDLPVTLTQGDQVSIPVAVYNYSGARGDVSLKLQPEDWFGLVGDVPDKNLAVEAGRVGGSQFTLEAKRIGKFKLTLAANMGGGANRADIVVREIEVVPNGREESLVFNGRLESSVQHAVNFPAVSIPDASQILVRLYPGPLSQVIEGMDSILRMPGGCFEQTSSSTYPNVLALDYMKRAKKLTPEVHAKAEGFIANGYQRLLTFEVPGGGFSWFGSAPANKILTAYGLMEFHDMAQVHDVDENVISRTQQWLAGQQQADGSWKPDASFINEGATNRYNSDLLRITAYLGWSLENTGYQGPAVDKARQFVEAHLGGAKPDAYTLAVLANFAADYGKDRDFTRQAMQLLLDARTEKDEQVWWNAEETGVYATGTSASVETTGLAVQALLKWGQASGTASKALAYLASKKDASGTWGTTQATIMALRALLLSTEKGAADVRGTVELTLNGKAAQKLTLTADNNDLLHQFVLTGTDANGANTVDLKFAGTGGLAYQVVGRYFVPWTEKPAGEPLSIDVAYDRTRLAQDDIATANATVRNNLGKAANMVMVDLGIPPGFDLLSEDLQSYQEQSAGRKSGRLEKFSLTATQAILYFDSIAPGDTVKLHFRLRAKYPIRARTFPSKVYAYYDPDIQAVARPVQLEVRARP